MTRTRTHTLSVLVLAGVLAVGLAGCAGGSANPSGSPSASASPTQTTPTPTPTPTETVPPVTPATLPTDCNALATDATRQETVGDMTLQGDGTGFVRPAPEGAQLALGCDWIIEEVAGVLLLISTADPAAVTATADALPAQGWTCGVSDDFGATFCSINPTDSGMDEEDMVVARDDVWIYIETYNTNARAFLSEIAQQIWG